MYLSKESKIIFIHIPKTAGESISQLLRSTEQNESQTLHQKSSLSQYSLIWSRKSYQLLSKSLKLSGLLPTFKQKLDQKIKNQNYLLGDSSQWKHATAKEILNVVGYTFFSNSFKFSFVRNPWDQVVSFYNHLRKPLYLPQYYSKLMRPHYACQIALQCNFHDWVLEIYNKEKLQQDEISQVNHFQNQCEWLCDSNENLIVDYIGKYESLEKDIEIIGKKIGRDFNHLPVRNRSQRKDYREYYDTRTKAIIGDFFEKDISLFEYDF
jgi:hypothetical protein